MSFQYNELAYHLCRYAKLQFILVISNLFGKRFEVEYHKIEGWIFKKLIKNNIFLPGPILKKPNLGVINN